MTRNAIADRFQQDAMAECHEQMLFRELCEAKQHAEQSGSLDDHRTAARAYVRYMRHHLTDPEQDVLRLEDEVIRLRAENKLLRGNHVRQ